MNTDAHNPTLDRPVPYRIVVSGILDEGWSDSFEGITVVREIDGGKPTTTLTGAFDQAALLGALRRLYAFGLVLISVNCLASESPKS